MQKLYLISFIIANFIIIITNILKNEKISLGGKVIFGKFCIFKYDQMIKSTASKFCLNKILFYILILFIGGNYQKAQQIMVS